MDEPSITDTQRDYLGALDRWLRAPTSRNARERQHHLSVIRGQAAIRPADHPEQREETSMAVDQPRPTKVVLADALAELQAREAKLQRLERELAENRAAIKVLRKLVGDAPIRQVAPAPVVAAPTPTPRPDAEERDALVLRIVTERQPVPRGILLRHTDLSAGALQAALARLRDAGKVAMVGEKAGARYVLAGHEETVAA